jgi:hypothetical protein
LWLRGDPVCSACFPSYPVLNSVAPVVQTVGGVGV